MLPLPLSVCGLQLAKEGALPLKHVRFFVLDECDKMLEKLGEFPGGRGWKVVRVYVRVRAVFNLLDPRCMCLTCAVHPVPLLYRHARGLPGDL